MPATKFGRSKRLHGKRGFEQVFRRGKVFREDWLNLYALPNGALFSRFGCTIRRGVASKAVLRNRLKRWLRESFRRSQSGIPGGFDLVARINRLPDTLSYQDTERTLRALCSQLKPLAGLS